MGGSGLVLWFSDRAARLLPEGFLPAALVAHSDEALLAILWILVVHLYFEHLSPRHFPLNTAIFTGRMAASKYRREHPLDHARLAEARAGVAGEASPPPTPSPEAPPAAGGDKGDG